MNDNEITAALSSLQPVSLEDIEGVTLMNRVETKYLFSASRLAELINSLDFRYKVLEISNLRVMPYTTTYLDTPDHLFYSQHVRGKLERDKIRFRKYESTGETFLEIKKKTIKGRTRKWRIENDPGSGTFNKSEINFINKHLTADTATLKPYLINSFTRTTLIGTESKERITLDYNISFSVPGSNRKVFMPYLAIAELKKDGHSNYSYFHNLLKDMHVRSTGFSKYCTGIALMDESLRRNMIKPKILLLGKIENEYIRSCIA
jgi:hypothetical protein